MRIPSCRNILSDLSGSVKRPTVIGGKFAWPGREDGSSPCALLCNRFQSPTTLAMVPRRETWDLVPHEPVGEATQGAKSNGYHINTSCDTKLLLSLLHPQAILCSQSLLYPLFRVQLRHSLRQSLHTPPSPHHQNEVHDHSCGPHGPGCCPDHR